jgi:uncharacterized protein with GYD domain
MNWRPSPSGRHGVTRSNSNQPPGAAPDQAFGGVYLLASALVMRYPPPFNSELEDDMPKYLLHVSYTAEGAKGLLKDGGSKRRAAAQAAMKSLGGKLETFYYAFGESDVFAIADLPDPISAAAASMTLAASGAVTTKTTVLLTAEDIDAAVKKSAKYTPPGS